MKNMEQEKEKQSDKQQERQQEILYKLSIFEQQMHQLQEQVAAVENGMNELGSLNFELDELKGSFGKEILAPVGRGIFVPATISSETLTVDVGGKNFVKKSISETKEIIDEQLKKLVDVKKDIGETIEKVSEEAAKTLKEFQE